VSVEALRRAAAGLREEWAGPSPMGTAWHRERDFHLAVADWLDGEAVDLDEALNALAFLGPARWSRVPDGRFGRALAVARAYLGDDDA
jgi:hypothetical protein